MKKAKILCGACLTALFSLTALTGCKRGASGEDQYDKDNRLIIKIKNVYFEDWTGEDPYTEELNNKFGIKIKASSYVYNDWDDAVYTAISGTNLPDVFQFNLKAYNFGSTYEEWVHDEMIKPLPDNLSKWPNIKTLINNASNIDSLKIDGKLYGIPVLNDTVNIQKDFSHMTYVYRRDWAKNIDEIESAKNPSYQPIYREGDVYTWEEFDRLCKAFKTYVPKKEFAGTDRSAALVDERWGFPSVTNFFKDVPHCYAKKDGKAINAFTSDEYLAGIDFAKDYVTQEIYSQDQFGFSDNMANGFYYGGQAAILYDNLTLTNYIKLRRNFQRYQKNVDVNDGTAILKIKGPDGKFALEGDENWFSMTLFNYDISQTKMEKVLDLIDYLLSDDGTKLAVFGKEGFDWTTVDGKPQVTAGVGNWEKADGKWVEFKNGARYLRYMASLGNETKSYDPYTENDGEAYPILNAWSEQMQEAKANGQLRVVKGAPEIDWMSSKNKNDYTEQILEDAKVLVTKYCFNKISRSNYISTLDNDGKWKSILKEINEKLEQLGK